MTAHPRRDATVAKFRELNDMEGVACALGVTRDTVRKHLKAAGIDTGRTYAEPATPSAAPEPKRLDLVEKHRFENNEKALKAHVKDLTQRLALAEDHRQSILGLGEFRIEPVCSPRVKQTGERGRQAAVLHISDTHVGEVVNLEETMGVNKFDREIAASRIARLFDTASILTTTAWPRSDDAPHRVYILLGGDLISGHGLHPELAETDAGTAYEQCKWAANYISP